jgi:LysM repeat protein
MSNSSLVQYTKLSPNCNKPRKSKIKKITIHHMAGVLSVETCGNIFQNPNRQASSNYAIGSDGRIAMYVEEANRSWCSSNAENDHQAITIEVSNSKNGGDWPVSDYVLSRLIDLCVDICKRNGISKLIYDGTKNGTLTRHNMFANTACPGPYLQSKFPYIAEEVNKRLNNSNNSDMQTPPLVNDPFQGVSDEELAKRVWKGEFGNGDERKQKLGSRYAAVQALVNKGIGKTPTPADNKKYHVVQKGDTLWSIAKKYYGNGNQYSKIVQANNIKNPDLIYPGQKLLIP